VLVCRDDVLLVLAGTAAAPVAVPAADAAARCRGGNLHVVIAHEPAGGHPGESPTGERAAPGKAASLLARRTVFSCLPLEHAPTRCVLIAGRSAIADAVEGFLEEESCREIMIAASGSSTRSRRLVQDLLRVSAPYRVSTALRASAQGS